MAFITGAYGGVGKCFAKLHADTGGDLILVGRNKEKLEEQASDIKKKYNINIHIIAADLSSAEAAERVYNTCHSKGWEVDYLINNAGFGGQGDFVRERPLQEDMNMIAVNVEALTRFCKLFIADMTERGRGRVLNVGSIASLVPGPLQAVYFATKAYVKSFSNALWQELKGTGVTVTCLMSGALSTGFASRGGLTKTRLFTNNPPPIKAAKAGYEAMLKGELNIVAGLPGIVRKMTGLLKLIPTKFTMNVVAKLQTPK